MSSFLEHIPLPHPAVPPGADGFTILHLSDFHIRFPLRDNPSRLARHRWLDQLLADLSSAPPADLVALTGDFLDRPEHEPLGLDLLSELSRAWKLSPRGRAIGIFGNHDTPRFRRLAREQADRHNILWPGDTLQLITLGPITLFALDHPEDLLAAGAALADLPAPPLITLVHEPTALIPAAHFNLPILLAGHTHGGQIRLSPRFAPHTSSDTPHHLAAGLLQLRSTLCAVSRGIGDGVLENLRINCPRQVPLYTLHHAALPAAPTTCSTPRQAIAW